MKPMVGSSIETISYSAVSGHGPQLMADQGRQADESVRKDDLGGGTLLGQRFVLVGGFESEAADGRG